VSDQAIHEICRTALSALWIYGFSRSFPAFLDFIVSLWSMRKYNSGPILTVKGHGIPGVQN
jgi:hypothetical protein